MEEDHDIIKALLVLRDKMTERVRELNDLIIEEKDESWKLYSQGERRGIRQDRRDLDLKITYIRKLIKEKDD